MRSQQCGLEEQQCQCVARNGKKYFFEAKFHIVQPKQGYYTEQQRITHFHSPSQVQLRSNPKPTKSHIFLMWRDKVTVLHDDWGLDPGWTWVGLGMDYKITQIPE